MANEGRKSRQLRLNEESNNIVEKDDKVVFRNDLRTTHLSQGGAVDILSGWNTSSIASMYGPNPVHIIWPAKTQLQVAEENRLIRQMVNQITDSIYKFNEKLREIIPGDEVLPQKDVLLRLVNVYLPSIIGEIFEYQKLALKKSKTVDLNKVLGFQKMHVEFEVAEGGQVHFDTTSEAQILNVLETKNELFLSYTHIYRAGRGGDRTGILDIEPGETFPIIENVSLSEAARHGTAVIGVVLDAEKRIEYLIIRNSWGSSGRTHYGYHYITPRYLWNDARQRLGRWLLK